MITNLEKIKESLDIEHVVARHVKMQRKGKRLSGLCPFHQEKTPSFTVNPVSQFCHCFGCGFSGDAIAFEMKINHCSFPEAVEKLAVAFHLEVHHEHGPNFDEQSYLKREQCFIANGLMLDWWQQQDLLEKLDGKVRLGDRWFEQVAIEHFNICLVPGRNSFFESPTVKSLDRSLLVDLGIIREKNGKSYSFFQDRIIFPLLNESGKIAGFSGRAMDKTRANPVKYLNSPESEIFKKSTILFGLFENKAAIQTAGEVIVVEGYTDVIRLWECGYKNAVAICGTSLSEHHASILKKYASKAILILDGDNAGKKALSPAFHKLEKAGLFTRICILPENQDPESYLSEVGATAFEQYLRQNLRDAIIALAEVELLEASDGIKKQQALERCQNYLANTPFTASSREWAVALADIFNVGDEQMLPHLTANNAAKSSSRNPIIEEDNAYYFQDPKGKNTLVSNFVIRPHYRSKTSKEVSWYFELENIENEKAFIRFSGKSLNAPDIFRQTIEQHGNFIFHGRTFHLNFIKEIIFKNLNDCIEIEQLGWQEGRDFWAWSNGITKYGQFYPTDTSGLVKIQDEKFLINSAFDALKSGTLEREEHLFHFEAGDRKFQDWADLIAELNAENGNGYLLVLYYLAALFRDVIFSEHNYFPLLFAFGERGTGKSQMAVSLGKMYGHPQKQFMLDSGTEIGMGRKAAKFCNAVVWFDEYKNSIAPKRIQFLKGLYDGAGHIRAEYSNDLRTNEVAIQSGVFITGQELPVADPALLSRVILLKTSKTVFSSNEKAVFNRLKTMEKSEGLSHITATLSAYHSEIKLGFRAKFSRIFPDFRKLLEAENPLLKYEDRLLNNYAVLLTMASLFHERGVLPEMFFPQAQKAVVNAIKEHQELMYNSDDRAQFWDIIVFLIDTEKLTKAAIFISEVTKIKINPPHDNESTLNFEPSKTLLFMRSTIVFPQYLKEFRQQNGREGLPIPTLKNYLKTCPAYLGHCSSWRFPNETVNSCLVFDYKLLGVRLFNTETL